MQESSCLSVPERHHQKSCFLNVCKFLLPGNLHCTRQAALESLQGFITAGAARKLSLDPALPGTGRETEPQRADPSPHALHGDV